jgi:hypothetical protein
MKLAYSENAAKEYGEIKSCRRSQYAQKPEQKMLRAHVNSPATSSFGITTHNIRAHATSGNNIGKQSHFP